MGQQMPQQMQGKGGFPNQMPNAPGQIPGQKGGAPGAPPAQNMPNMNMPNQGVQNMGARPAGAQTQGNQPLTAQMLANAPPGMQKQMLGEKLFPAVSRLQPELAGKITGMMLEMDNTELLLMLDSEAQLRQKVDEAMRVLNQRQGQ